MMRTGIIILLLSVVAFTSEVRSQQRIAAAPANLQLTGESSHGEEIQASSRNLNILYEQSTGKGELNIGTLTTSNEEISDLLMRLRDKIIYINFPIPEGKFAFGDSMNERFSTQVQLKLEDTDSEFTLELDVSNIRDGKKNNFKVIGRGRLSLSEHFHITEDLGVKDGFGFVFNQNLKVYQP